MIAIATKAEIIMLPTMVFSLAEFSCASLKSALETLSDVIRINASGYKYATHIPIMVNTHPDTFNSAPP